MGRSRFHAVYWPAFLLSAGHPIPTRIQVHPYISLDGTKLSKSSGTRLAPVEIAQTYSADDLRWWITSDVNPISDTDFTLQRLVSNANDTLANGFGNAVNRVTTLRHRQPRHQPVAQFDQPAASRLDTDVATALADFDRRAASEHITTAGAALNQQIDATEPWKLARRDRDSQHLAQLLETYLATLRNIAHAMAPITRRCPNEPSNSSRTTAHHHPSPSSPDSTPARQRHPVAPPAASATAGYSGDPPVGLIAGGPLGRWS